MQDEENEEVATKSTDEVGENRRLFTERDNAAKKQSPNQQAEMEVVNESIPKSRVVNNSTIDNGQSTKSQDKPAEPRGNNIQHTRSNRVSLPLETEKNVAQRNNSNRLVGTESVANNSNAKAGEL